MTNLIKFFTPKFEMSLFEKLKTKAFIVLNLLAIILNLCLAVQATMGNYKVSMIAHFMMCFFELTCLVLLRYYGIKVIGNIFVTGIVVLAVIAQHISNDDVVVMYKFVKGFYFFLMLTSIGVLYSTKPFLIINAVLMLFTTFRVYFLAIAQVPEQKELFKIGIINHTTAFTITATLVYFAILFAEKAIEAAKNDANLIQQKNRKLKEVFAIAKATVTKLDGLSNEINISANSLSTSSSEQASNIEEISATIEEMTSSVIQNTEKTEGTALTVNNTSQLVKKSQEAINRTMQAVEEVDDKIGIIQEIAFKTNILALNAAIEAARAGQAGKGFSVVANEVKKLAENSSEGAKSIIELIDITKKVSNEAGNYHKQITEDIGGVDSSITHISYSSVELKNNIEQINTAINQINTGAQNNAAISDKLANSIEELSLHTQKLNNIVEESY